MNEVAAAVPRVALTRLEAAASLGISLDSFERHVQPEIGLIRRGRLVLVPVAELVRWAEIAVDARTREVPGGDACTLLVEGERSPGLEGDLSRKSR